MKMKMSVMIPAYNEECVIGNTITALFASGFSANDIYIIDDLSTDNTYDIAKSYGVNVHRVSVNGGKAKAQIEGLRQFDLYNNYHWIILLDGDTKVTPKFKSALVDAATNDPTVALFVGQVQSDNNSHIFSASRAYEYTFGQEICKKGQDNFNVIYVSPGCASMYNSKVLKQLHIDSSTLAEDMDLTVQVHRKHGKVRYIHDAIVITQDPITFTDYHKQIMRWSRGVWQVIAKHGIFNPFKRKQLIDLYMMYLAIDSLVLNKFFIIFIMLSTLPLSVVGIGILLDFAVFAVIGLFVAYKTKRSDVLLKMPIYYWLSYLNLYAFMRSFVEIIIFRKEILVWNKVKRYEFNH